MLSQQKSCETSLLHVRHPSTKAFFSEVILREMAVVWLGTLSRLVENSKRKEKTSLGTLILKKRLGSNPATKNVSVPSCASACLCSCVCLYLTPDPLDQRCQNELKRIARIFFSPLSTTSKTQHSMTTQLQRYSQQKQQQQERSAEIRFKRQDCVQSRCEFSKNVPLSEG